MTKKKFFFLSEKERINNNISFQLSVFMACLMACQGFVVPPTTLVRAPSHDSAVIRSDRLGGNFAYSVQEGHAYAAISPVVQHVATPVAVSYETPAVVPSTYSYPQVPLPVAPIALEAPKYEVKTVEVPQVEVKAIEAPAVVAAPYGYGYEHVGHIPVAGPTVTVEAPKYEVKTIEVPKYEVKTIEAPAVVAAPHSYSYQHAFPLAPSTFTVGVAH